MPFDTDPLAPASGGVLDADPADVLEQSRAVDLDGLIEDYPWVRRDAVVTIGGRRFFL